MPVPEKRLTLLESRRAVARRVDHAFADHPEVASVLVFGSVASGEVDERSDVDLLVVSRSRRLPPGVRRRVLSGLGSGWRFRDRRDDNPLFADQETGGVVDGVPVEVCYQTAPWISAVLGQVLERGALTTAALPFRPYTLPGLLQRAWLLTDKDGAVARWREQAAVFPEALRANLLRRFAPVLREHAEELSVGAERGFGARVFVFHLDRAMDALFSVLWALNGVYDPADKRAELTVLPRLGQAPADLLPTLARVLEGPFDPEGALARARLFRQVTGAVLRMAEAQVDRAGSCDAARVS